MNNIKFLILILTILSISNLKSQNDSIITGDFSGTVIEDFTLTATGIVTINDVDTADNPSFIDATITSPYGSFQLSGNDWTYILDNNTSNAIQSLNEGETVLDTFIIEASDGNTQIITITIFGIDDASIITGDFSDIVIEDITLTATGIVAINDVDTADNPSFIDATITSPYGSFQLSGNDWTYILDNNTSNAIQSLNEGETVLDTFIIEASDGNTQIITITIFGTDETTLSLNNVVKYDFKIYPNPVTDIINIEGLSKNVSIEIYNTHGQKLIQKSVNENKTKIQVSNFSSGIYFLKINQVTYKFIKK